MPFKRLLSSCICSLLCLSCLERFNPRPFWKKLAEERQIAHFTQFNLTPEGKLPDVKGIEVPVYKNEADQHFATLCASCHGPDGKAGTASAMALNPMPRNLSDMKWQNSVTDDHLEKVLVGGGGAVGLSSVMPAWGGVLSIDQIKALVKKIRELGGT